MKRYGDVPLLIEPISVDEANSFSRNSKEEIIDFIISECDAVKKQLPNDYLNVHEIETGRVTKGTAIALKARTLMYAASPLFNPENEISKWVAAANAAAEVINMGYYSLEAKYNDVFTKFSSKELIWWRGIPSSNSFEKVNFPVGYNGEPGTCPTQNLVDAYEMLNGIEIDNPLSD